MAGDQRAQFAGADADELPILHVDMDAFYVEVERKRDPSLVGRPVIVGGSGRRGVVASASYEARAAGVHAAMPTARARRLCPSAVVVTSDFSGYAEASGAIAEVFESVTPLVEPIALDEAFLDVSGAHRLFGTSPQIAWRLRGAVRQATGLDCSVGAASNKTLAKLASVAAKPIVGSSGPQPGLGVRVVELAEQLDFLWAHRVEALWGVGPVTLERLNGIGVLTVGDLAAVPLERLVAAVGTAHGSHLALLAQGIDDRPVRPGGIPRSVSHEETFETDLRDPDRIRGETVRLADAVASRLRANGLAGRTVTVKVKYPDFSLRTRARTLAEPVQTPRMLVQAAHALVAKLDLSLGVRLLGVAVSNICETSASEAGGGAGVAGTAATEPEGQIQLALEIGMPPVPESGAAADAGPGPTGDAELDRRLADALDVIRGRFGRAIISHGAAGLRDGAPGERRWGR
ncbi:DNA polymerase IV [Candidatus Poriferisodalis sp.]|uniref:DNA polymerase IV n=1 Tax=Candidatus Poriferisodalis sp. TaxID=3101277 RepID=UPI003B0270D3